MTHQESTQRLAVLSDIHANALALKAALEAVRTLDVDTLVILGDLLTYGCTPEQTLDLVSRAFHEWPTVLLIIGNHDQLYFDLAHNDFRYFDNLPGWIQESVRWTREQVPTDTLRTRYPWRTDAWWGTAYISHANPFGDRDWHYLNTGESLEAAAHALQTKGANIGIFGHTHRSSIVALTSEGKLNIVPDARKFSLTATTDDRIVIVNPGSVGQSRSQDNDATFLTLTAHKESYDFEIHPVVYDGKAHKRSIENAQLSMNTKQKLMGFYKEETS